MSSNCVRDASELLIAHAYRKLTLLPGYNGVDNGRHLGIRAPPQPWDPYRTSKTDPFWPVSSKWSSCHPERVTLLGE